MVKKKAHRASEGKTMVDYRGPVKDTVQEILGGLRSACTYAGAKTIKDLKMHNVCACKSTIK